METIFTLESNSGHTWYIDFDETKQFPYRITYIIGETIAERSTLGEALEYIFKRLIELGITNFTVK